ncbi:glycerophosphodiester phosphodiesterase [Nitrincola sp. MINF-07-Sa-05]|uniref:glycerophosphodiester phosphodiesterase n=1 Tax=Nitrincola salilacus TaxID=3400273 RepID=UPI003917F458
MSGPVWISHRGYSQLFTENTSNAFDAAVDLGFTHFETDLRTTCDGHLVLCHDPDLERIAGFSRSVEGATRSELASLQLKTAASTKCALLFFDEMVERYAEYRWTLDIKPESGMQTLSYLLHLWTRPGYKEFLTDQVRFLFWRKEQEQYLLGHHPDAICMVREGGCRRAGVMSLMRLPSLAGILPGKVYSLPSRFMGIEVMRPEMVSRYHAYGAKVLAFLPETDEDAKQAIESGVDEILTNHRILL